VTGLSNSTAYVFRVAAVNSAGTGRYSANSNSVTQAADATIGTTGTLSAMTTTYGTASVAMKTAIAGSGLSAAITATAPSGFEVSSNGSAYASTASFNPTSGAVSGTLYVRLAAKMNAGTYSGSVIFSSPGATNVTAAIPSSTVNPKTLTVRANDAVRTYGANNPAFSAAFSGFAAGETAPTALTGQAQVTTTATATSSVGTYLITPAAGTLAATNGNYTFSFVTGTLTVNKANLTVVLDNKTKVQNASDPVLTYGVRGLVNGHKAADVLTGAASRAPGETAGSYAMSQGTLALQSSGVASNYTLQTVTNGTLRVLTAAKPLFVSGVFVRGSAWVDNYLGLPTFATASGGTRLGLALGDGTGQLGNAQLVTWNNVNRVSVRFSKPIANPGGTSLVLRAVTGSGAGTQTTIESTAVTLSEGDTVATWTVPTLASGKYLLVLRSSAITAATGGGRLDGEWTNASSTFATGSGDGTAGGDFEYRFNVLVGDVNASGTVLTGDKTAVQSALATAVTATNYRLDIDGTGRILLTDANAAGAALASGLSRLTALGEFAPVLTAAAGATVDTSFDVTFPENAAWRSAMTGIKAGATAGAATALNAAAWNKSAAGKITFDPALAAQLQTGGSQVLVISATGYADVTVTQSLAAGAAAKLGIGTQPVGPEASGGILATQPVVRIQDKYGNNVSSTATVTAEVEATAGSWTLGGTLLRNAVSGMATFAGLTATSGGGAVSGAKIRFRSGSLLSVVSDTFRVPPAA
jgi:hypothetical protein